MPPNTKGLCLLTWFKQFSRCRIHYRGESHRRAIGKNMVQMDQRVQTGFHSPISGFRSTIDVRLLPKARLYLLQEGSRRERHLSACSRNQRASIDRSRHNLKSHRWVCPWTLDSNGSLAERESHNESGKRSM